MATIGEFISASRNNPDAYSVMRKAAADNTRTWSEYGDSWLNYGRSWFDPATEYARQAGKSAVNTGQDWFNYMAGSPVTTGYNNGQTGYQIMNTSFGSDKGGQPYFNYTPPGAGNDFTLDDTLLQLNIFAKNRDYANGIIAQMQNTPQDQRANIPFIKNLQNVATELKRYGQEAEATKLQEGIQSLITGVGNSSGNIASLDMITNYAQNAIRGSLNGITKSTEGTAANRRLTNANTQADEVVKSQNFQDAINNLKQNNPALSKAYTNPAGNALGGWFDSPEMQGAFHNAAPWLSYGVPLATMASVFGGTNKLWPLVLGGGLLFGGLGYAKNKGWLGEFGNSQLMNGITDFHTYLNQPLQGFSGMVFPGSERLSHQLLGQGPYDPPKTQALDKPSGTSVGSTIGNFINTNKPADTANFGSGAVQVPETYASTTTNAPKPITQNTQLA